MSAEPPVSTPPNAIPGSLLSPSRARFPINVAIVFLYFAGVILSVQWQRSKLMDRLIVSAATEAAREQAQMLTAVRTVYTEEIIPVALENGLQITHEPHTNLHSVPLPATFALRIGERMAESGQGGRTRLYSPYPFPWRAAEGGLRDDFQKEAWERLQADPQTPVVRTSNTADGRVLRYAVADRMRASCVKCHNEHPDSPRTGWKEGDVRGVLEVELSLEQSEVLAGQNLMESSALLAVLAIAGGGVVVYTMLQFTRASTILENSVRERTSDLECANVVLQAEVDERVRAESALRLSEFSVANASLPTYWIASDARILRVNRAVGELLGYSDSELLALSITDLDPDFNTERWPAHWQELREKKRMSFETRQRHKAGHIIPIEVDLNWFEFEGVEYNFAFIRDITERKRDKELLAQRAVALETQRLDALDLAREAEDSRQRAQRSEERLNLALKSSGVGTWSWNIVENSIFWDEYLHPLFGLQPGTFGGTFEAFAARVAPEERERVQREVTASVEQRAEYDTEYRVIWPDESFHVLAARGKVYRDAVGHPLSMTGVCWDVTQRHLVERSLQESQERFALAVEGSRDGIWDWNVSTNEVYFSTRWKSMLGYEDDEIANQFSEWERLVHPEDLAQAQQMLNEYFAGQRPEYTVELRMLHKSGDWRWILARGVARRDANGTIVRMSGSHTDISERKLAEERFRLVVEAAPNSIVVVNRARNITLVNSQTETLFGYRRDELIGQPIEILVPERFRPGHPTYVEGFFGTPQRRAMGVGRYLFGLKKSGEEFSIELGLSPFTTSEGMFVLASVLDITARIRAEVELHRAKEAAESANRVLDSSLKSIADGVIVADATGKFLFWNEEAEEIIGLGMTETPIEGWAARYGCFLPDMVTPFPSEDLPLARTIRGEDVHEVDLFIRNPKKPEGVWISINGRPMRDDANVVQGGVIVFRDMTERRESQETLARQAEELARSNTELQQFAYIASHDLQEPLRKVQAFGDLLAKDAGPALSVDGLDYLKRMQNAAARMQQLINDLLTYSRVTSQAQPFVSVDLARIASEVLSDLESRIASTGGQVQLGELPSLDADPLQMRQLLQNLIGNALKFHRKDVPPVVSVQCQRVTPETGVLAGRSAWEITVQDNGIGFDEKYLVKLFAPFQRLHGRTEYEGTGIGLAICKKIVDRHGGTITARSVPGEGTRFIATLPQAQETGVPQHAAGDSHHAQTR